MEDTNIGIYVLVPLLISITTPSLGQVNLSKSRHQVNVRLERNSFSSDDSEGFQTRRIIQLEFLPRYEDADHYLGVRGSAYGYRADEWQSRWPRRFPLLGVNIEYR